MEFWKNTLSFLQSEMQTPTNYSWFHLMFIAFVIIGSFFAIKFAKKSSAKAMKIVLIVASGVMLLLEVYKQIVFTFSIVNGQIVGDYQWFAFPFQFCSTPMYVMLIAGLSKSGRFQSSLTAYLSLFSLFGGLCVYFYPNDVFINMIGINFQTMIHHGLQIVIGCYLLSYHRNELNLKFFLKSIPVFITLVAIAMGLNLLAPTFTTETFNMFFISPFFPCTIVILNTLYAVLPYPLFLLLYLFGFCLASCIMFLIAFAFGKIFKRKKIKKINMEKNKKI